MARSEPKLTKEQVEALALDADSPVVRFVSYQTLVERLAQSWLEQRRVLEQAHGAMEELRDDLEQVRAMRNEAYVAYDGLLQEREQWNIASMKWNAEVERLQAELDRVNDYVRQQSADWVQTDWRRCPGCGERYPHPSVTSTMLCPSCRHNDEVERLRAELERVEAERQQYLDALSKATIRLGALSTAQARIEELEGSLRDIESGVLGSRDIRIVQRAQAVLATGNRPESPLAHHPGRQSGH